jgi:hypothetical protein
MENEKLDQTPVNPETLPTSASDNLKTIAMADPTIMYIQHAGTEELITPSLSLSNNDHYPCNNSMHN